MQADDKTLRGFSESDLAHRRPVWEALSNLFLDTDTRLFDDYIVEKLATSPYSISELEDILIREVRPVCGWNIFWWEWISFDPEWLEEQILKKQRSPFRFFYRLLEPMARLLLRGSFQWRAISKRVQQTRIESKTSP